MRVEQPLRQQQKHAESDGLRARHNLSAGRSTDLHSGHTQPHGSRGGWRMDMRDLGLNGVVSNAWERERGRERERE